MTTFDEISVELQAAFNRSQALKNKFDIDTSHIELNAGETPTIGELVALFTKIFDAGVSVPAFPLDNAKFRQFRLSRGDSSRNMPANGNLSLDLGKQATWQVAPGLELGLVTIDLDYFAGNWTGFASGKVTLSEIEFEISVEWPSLVIEGIAKPKAAQLKKLADSHGFDPHNSAPALESMRVLAISRTHAVHFTINAKNLCAIGPIHLDRASLRLNYSGGVNAAFTGSISTEFSAANLDFEVSVAKTLKGWEATAHAIGNAPLADIVGDLSQHLHKSRLDLVAAGVPADIAATQVTGEVTLTANSGEKHATLQTSVALSTGAAHFEIDIAPGVLSVKAYLILGDLRFEVDFSSSDIGQLLIGQFVSESGLTLRLQELVSLSMLTSSSAPTSVGAAVDITVHDVLVAMHAPGQPQGGPKVASKFLVAADLDGGIDLSGLGNLPLVGALMPRNIGLRLSLAPVLMNKAWADKESAALRTLKGEEGPSLPDTLDKPRLGMSLQLPGRDDPLDLGIELGDLSQGKSVALTPAATSTPPAPIAAGDKLTWKTLNKKLGPVAIQRIGFGLDKSRPKEPRVRLLFDASLGMAGLELSLVGFGAHYVLSTKDLGVELSGMGIDVNKPPLRIAGGFAKMDVKVANKTVTQYLGKVQLAAKTFSIAASGGFAMLDGNPSMFIYGVLNTPIGGPPFFFVEGLAAGFGINRNLKAPNLDQVHDFPFVTDAMGAARGDAAKTPTIAEGLASLAAYVEPRLGQYFLAAGIKFTSFKLLDSFVLVMVGFGNETKIDLVGISSFQNPPIVPPGFPAMVRIELDLVATIRPAEGSVVVRASLAKDSYVYSPVVQLSGGFAFASWFSGKHAGDFVISAGGYHPKFKRPAHYPPVDRIGLTFKVPGFDVWIKGTAYFALTPSMMMAGGAIEAHAEFEGVEASFGMWLDFLIKWEPYHYDMRTGVTIAAKWGPFHTHASASLHIWGPKFTGYAKVEWFVFEFDVDFGHSIGTPIPISWEKFEQSFLPHESVKPGKKIRTNIDPTIKVTSGLVATIGGPGKEIHVVNPKELEILVDTVVPFCSVGNATVSVDKSVVQLFGCGPVGVKQIITSDLAIQFDGTAFNTVIESKRFPAAMWGPPRAPDLKAEATILAGGSVTLSLDDPIKPTGETRVLRGAVKYEPPPALATVTKPSDFIFSQTTKATKAVLITATSAASGRRAKILDELDLDIHRATLRDSLLSELRGEPLSVKAT